MRRWGNNLSTSRDLPLIHVLEIYNIYLTDRRSEGLCHCCVYTRNESGGGGVLCWVSQCQAVNNRKGKKKWHHIKFGETQPDNQISPVFVSFLLQRKPEMKARVTIFYRGSREKRKKSQVEKLVLLAGSVFPRGLDSTVFSCHMWENVRAADIIWEKNPTLCAVTLTFQCLTFCTVWDPRVISIYRYILYM